MSKIIHKIKNFDFGKFLFLSFLTLFLGTIMWAANSEERQEKRKIFFKNIFKK